MSFTQFTNFVDGKPRDSTDTNCGINPATEEELWPVPRATEEDLDDAVSSAQKAFPAWSKTPYDERCRLLRNYAEAILSYENDFTDLIMTETGKPRDIANREVHSSYPLILSLTKIAPALATGCCIIVKPSPFTPYSALKAIEIGQSIFPPGVLQALGGDDKLGPWMVAHPDIQKISFTGSIPTGKKIMEVAARTLKRVTLELGGNDAAIVCPDVDIAKTAPAVVLAAFKNSGQICVASKRIYVHEDIYQPFLKAMADFTDGLKVGNPFDKDVDLGPIQNGMQYDKVQSFFTDCEEKRYVFVAGGRKCTPHIGKGFFVQPTIIANPPNDSRIVSEEPFGPIISRATLDGGS